MKIRCTLYLALSALIAAGLCQGQSKSGSCSSSMSSTCNPAIVESYGIISYLQPAKESLVFCGNIKASCCPAFEQFKMYDDFDSRIRNNFIILNQLIIKELELLQKEVTALIDSKLIEQKIAAITDKAMKLKLQTEYRAISRKNFSEIISKALRHQPASSNYISAIKSAFFCTVCDFTNQMFIDVNKKTITYNSESCDALAKNTILYSYLLNRIIVPYLEKLSYVVAKLRNSSKYQKIHGLGRVEKAIKDCQEEILTSATNTGLSACRKYCGFFQMNSENFVFEGYPEFFANALVDIRQFVKGVPSRYPDPPKPAPVPDPSAAGTAATTPGATPATPGATPATPATPGATPATPATPGATTAPGGTAKRRRLRQARSRQSSSLYWDNYNGRVLEGQRKLSPGSRRIMAELRDNTRRRLDDAELGHKKLTERLLQGQPAAKDAQKTDEEIDEFDFDNRVHEVDLFDSSSDDPNLQDAMLNDMMEIQNAFNSENKGDVQKLVLKLFAERFTPEIPDIDSSEIFSAAPGEKVDLSKFSSKFEFAGIALDSIVNGMNWNLGFDKITASLTGGAGENSEAIDPGVLDTINMVGNKDIRKFQTDNFAQFGDLQETDFINDVRFGLEEDQILLLQRDIVEETAAYEFILKSLQDKSQADSIWKDIITKKQKLAALAKAKQAEADLAAAKAAIGAKGATGSTGTGVTGAGSNTQPKTRRRKLMRKGKKRAHKVRRHHRRAHHVRRRNKKTRNQRHH